MTDGTSDGDFSLIDLERSVAEERRARIMNVSPDELSGSVQLSSSIRWLVKDEALYHYTSPSGLIGLLTQKRIWATSLWHMSDASELHYARNLYREVLDETAVRATSDDLAALECLSLIESHLLDSCMLFAACFCRSGDLLSQWRGYAGETGGFAVGLHLPESLPGWDGWERLEVIYDVERQRQQVSTFFAGALRTLAEHPEPAPGEPWPELAQIQKRAVLLMASLKHPAFEAEQEVRIVQWRHRSALMDVLWRSTNQMVIPYVEFPLSESETPPYFGRPPVVDLVIGPTEDEVTTRKSLEMLLEQHGYTFRLSESVRVRRSQAPLRTK